MSDQEEEGYIRKAVEAFKATSPSGKVPVGVGHSVTSESFIPAELRSGTTDDLPNVPRP